MLSPPADAARITKRLQRKKMLSSMPPSGGFAKRGNPPADAARITKRLRRKKMLSGMPPSGGSAKKEKENGRPLQGLPFCVTGGREYRKASFARQCPWMRPIFPPPIAESLRYAQPSRLTAATESFRPPFSKGGKGKPASKCCTHHKAPTAQKDA